MFNLKKEIVLNSPKRMLRIVVCATLSLFLSSALFAHGQTYLNGSLKLKAKNMTIAQVIAEIEKQSDYSFFYEDAKFDKNRKVTINADGKPIDEIINDLFSEGENTIYVDGKQVFIVQKVQQTKTLETQQTVKKKTVKGIVVDKSGETLIGATVSVVGTQQGTSTDLNGQFSIANVAENATLQVSYVGYVTQTFKATDEEIRIVLDENAQVLESVIVTALGIKRDEKALGYSAQRIEGDAAAVVKGVDIRSALTGKIAGLQVNNSTDFNGEPKLRLRGAEPLIVIDGVPMSGYVGLRELSPDDIETYDVLKGGSASALYGNAGRNGAIMVTTKRGKKDGVTVSVNSNTMFHAGFVRLPKTQSSYSAGTAGAYTNPEKYALDYVWGDKLDIGREAYQYNPETQNFEMMPLTSRGKDNFKDFLESGLITNNNVNIAYKGQKGSFRSSLTHVYEKGVFPNNKMNKFTFSMSGDMQLAENVKFDASMNYNKRYIPQTTGTGYHGNGYIYNLLVWTGADYRLSDFKNYWKNEKEGEVQNWFYKQWYNNPYFVAYEQLSSTFHDKLMSQFNLTYDPTSWLKTITRVGYEFTSIRDEQKTPLDSRTNASGKGAYWVSNLRRSVINGDFIMMAEHRISDFSIDALLGTGIKFDEYSSSSASTKGGLTVPGYYSLQAGAEGQTASSSTQRTQTNSVYGKIGLGYKSLAFIEATGRNDWSSRLDKDNRSYFYPSLSASFIPSELLPMPSWFELWKLRGGWAVSKIVPGFSDIVNAYSVDDNQWNSTPGATYPDNLRPKSLKPAKQSDWEIGTEMYFLNGRLRFDLAYYTKVFSDRIAQVKVSGSSGYDLVYINRNEEYNRTGYELTISGTPIVIKDFEWESSFNWTRERQHYTQMDDLTSDNLWTYKGARTDVVVDQKWDRTEDGQLIHGSNGMPVRKPRNEKLGYSMPNWIFGFTNTFKYKDFSLNISLDGKIGGLMFDQVDQAMWHSGSHIDSDTPWRYDEVVNGNKSYIGKGVKIVSGSVDYDSYGRVISDTRVFEPNDIEVSYESYTRQYQTSTAGHWGEHQYKKKTFIKLRELSLAYNLPRKVTSKMKINNASVAFVGQNLLMWAKDFKYSDPDVDERGMISPLVRYMGLNVKFEF